MGTGEELKGAREEEKDRKNEGRYKTMKVNIIIILSIYLIKIVHAKMKWYIPVFEERNFDLRLKVIHREGGIKKKTTKQPSKRSNKFP